MATQFFEGPEKKVELALKPGSPPLRGLGEEYWRGVVAKASAEVLSRRSTEFFDAYLLSESSLFVYDDHVTMITCGQTRLCDAVLHMVDTVGQDQVALLIYERKNEHFPENQPSTFFDDASCLRKRIAGQALSFGDHHSHRIHVFSSSAPFTPEESDTTLEILMHDISAERAADFCGAAPGLAARLGLERLLPGFEIDEFAFSPAGYSLNALSGPHYYTVHVTPEAVGSYVSFETNIDFREDYGSLVGRVVEFFQPDAFDVFAFEPGERASALTVDGYALRRHVAEQLNGYQVSFFHWFRPGTGPEAAREIVLE